MTIEQIRRIAQALVDRRPIKITDEETQIYNETCLFLADWVKEAQMELNEVEYAKVSQ